MIGKIIQAAIAPVASIFTAREARKQAKTTGMQKIQEAQLDNDSKLQLTVAEWEVLNSDPQNLSWKDEYVTVIGTLPYPLVTLGALAAAFGRPEILDGSLRGIAELQRIGIDVGMVFLMVTSAAVGLKIWRGK